MRSASKKLKISEPSVNGSPSKATNNLDQSSSSAHANLLNESAQTPRDISLRQEGRPSRVGSSLENEVEVSIVDENGKQAAGQIKVNGIASKSSSGDSEISYSCSCVEGRPPVATVPPAATLYCQAVDSVGGKQVGCCLVAVRKRFYRPSKKIAFMILCESHRDRIRKHFCCPGCGLFCTQVRFEEQSTQMSKI